MFVRSQVTSSSSSQSNRDYRSDDDVVVNEVAIEEDDNASFTWDFEKSEGFRLASVNDLFRNKVLKSSASQTEPIDFGDDALFDWDLSDRNDIETQTLPPTRAASTTYEERIKDAIAQTDQRLVFLQKKQVKATRSKSKSSSPLHDNKRAARKKVRFHDASVQTYVEVQEIGVQVTPRELPDAWGPQPIGPLSLASVRDDDYSDDEGIELSSSPLHYAQSDAGFQINMASDEGRVAVTVRNNHQHRGGDVSSPVGHGLQKSLQFSDSMSTLANSAPPSASASAASSAKVIRVQKATRKKAKSRAARLRAVKVDVAIQTDNNETNVAENAGDAAKTAATAAAVERQDPRTAHHAPRKYELIGDDPFLFATVDKHVLELSSQRHYKSLKKIVKELILRLESEDVYAKGDRDRRELIRVRAFFRWVAENVAFDAKCADRQMTTVDILREKRGVAKHYVKIFNEMCQHGGIKVKDIEGFAKGHGFMPGKDRSVRKVSKEKANDVVLLPLASLPINSHSLRTYVRSI